jgi:hypothetical protein
MIGHKSLYTHIRDFFLSPMTSFQGLDLVMRNAHYMVVLANDSSSEDGQWIITADFRNESRTGQDH